MKGCGTEAADGQAGATCGEAGVLCPGCREAAEEAQRQAAEATLKQRIGRLVVPEAQFGVMFPAHARGPVMPVITIGLSCAETHEPNTIVIKVGTACVHMTAAEARTAIAVLQSTLAKAHEKWTECPHGNLIPSGEDGPCGCRAG